MTPRGGYPVGMQQPYSAAGNAALLIDFDNVTMAIRSDLGKELKTLLRSEVIRGKVAVQRAYADWRRYPQYIVPLTESSVDLIFAPAYGSSKKNATDLRMAIDAIELVFTRPEIGTFILMTGDSDFSSCVLKLKEYGKYVIGVGMRESSSDLLIQNCDEYYSYHSISGLTRAGEVKESTEDPWVLVTRAVQQMVKDGDVMRTDRLKQVMIDLEPGFDEKKLGYSKFSRFVSEAASKGLLKLKKSEAGQYEIVTDEQEADTREKVVERIVAEAEGAGNGRRRRGRGVRGDRGPREERPAPRPSAEAGAADADTEPLADAPAETAADAEERVVTAGAEPEAAEPGAAGGFVEEHAPVAAEGLEGAYALLQEAVRRLTGPGAKTVRDGDVKRRMLEISRDFDETRLGFPKFTRFLRQAHDAEVIDLNRTSAGNYEVSLSAGGKRLPPPTPTAVASPAAERSPVAEETKAPEAPAAPRAEAAKPATGDGTRPAGGAAARGERETAAKPAEPLVPAKLTSEAPPAQATMGGMRGRRGARGPLGGPPPILPGQAIALPSQPKEATPPASEPAAEPPAAEVGAGVESEKPSRARRGRRGRGRKDSATAATEAAAAAATAIEGTEPATPGDAKAAASEAEAAPTAAAGADQGPAAEAASPSRSRRGRRGRGGTKKAAPGEPESGASSPEAPVPAEEPAAGLPAAPADSQPPREAAPASAKRGRGGRGRKPAAEAKPPASTPQPAAEPAFSPAALGLPGDAAGVIAHLSAYKGVGKKTAEALVDRYGTGVFEALESKPDEIRGVLGDRRAETVLGQWAEDRVARSPAPTAESGGATADAAPAAEPARRPRRGGRGQGSRKESAPKG